MPELLPPNIMLDDKLHWYKDAIIYELHIKAFHDGNRDGIGDFSGLLQKLDYLQDLGITAIWLLPFYPSPLKDDGYDIADYYSIHPSYGTIKQFKQLLKEAHDRNLRVITELVINHTSDQHEWFQQARYAPKGSQERNFYVWTDDPGKYRDVRIIFQDFEVSNWTWDSVAQQYYWHRFFHHQPDLNYDNPKVQEEVFKIIDYWCKMGVDGFRLDAVPYLFERESTNGENLPETHAFLKKLRGHVDEKFPGTLLLAEANMWPEDSASYFGNGDECNMNYHFPVMPRLFMALRMEDRYPITDIIEQTPAIPETCQWAIFLRNHDELTLEMVTDEERDYMYKVYAKDPEAKINLGIRHRLAPLMDNNRRKIELMNYLLFSLPGTPVVYYGDEIGMGDNFYLGDRNGVRTPMQWSPDRNAGFSEANPQQLYLPLILDPEYHYESVNVETQYGNPSSLLWYMKRVINMRKKYKAFGRGSIKFITVNNPKILAFTRNYEDQNILVVVNLSRYSQAAELDLREYKGYLPMEVFSKNKFPAVREDSDYFFTLAPHAYHWFLFLKEHPQSSGEIILPSFKLNTWKELVEEQVLEELANGILPDYLYKSKWFEGKDRSINRVVVTGNVPLPDNVEKVYLLLIEVNYENGLPEIYQLPVAFITESDAARLKEEFPHSIICRLNIHDEKGFLYDAVFMQTLQQEFISRTARSTDILADDTQIEFTGNKKLRKYWKEHSEIKSRLFAQERSYIAITYDECFFLKIYRKVDWTINPDVEVSKFLSEKADFPYIPAFTGLVEWKREKDSIAIAMMQEKIENHGDGWTFMMERLNTFFERILARDKEVLPATDQRGNFIDPVSYDELPDNLRELIGATAAERSHHIGMRTGEMHIALSSDLYSKEFKPEEFSLHYQRSLFSGFQSLVRASFNALNKNLKKLPGEIRPGAERILDRKQDILNLLKKVYAKKLDIVKIRIHGNYRLKQLLFTGKDIAIRDFMGDPRLTFSERRLKRSPVRDVAEMICEFYYAFEGGLLKNAQIRKEDIPRLTLYADFWTHYISSFFLHSYFEKVQGTTLIPKGKEDLRMLLETFLMERALDNLFYEVTHRPEWAGAPLRIINTVLR